MQISRLDFDATGRLCSSNFVTTFLRLKRKMGKTVDAGFVRRQKNSLMCRFIFFKCKSKIAALKYTFVAAETDLQVQTCILQGQLFCSYNSRVVAAVSNGIHTKLGLCVL